MTTGRMRRGGSVRTTLATALVLALIVAGFLAWRDGWFTGGVGAAVDQPTMPAPAPPTATPGGCQTAAVEGIPKQSATKLPLPTAAQAKAALDRLAVSNRLRGNDFCRAAFGPSTWPDLDANGCTTRQDILVRQAKTLTTARIKAHGSTCDEAITGAWADAYTGAAMSFTNLKDPAQAEQIQIDHLVSLFNAWVSGARDWTPQRRVAFAQDLTTSELNVVTDATNLAKSYRGVDSWQPAPVYRCAVAGAYIQVKERWDLTVTTGEKQALADMLATCPGLRSGD